MLSGYDAHPVGAHDAVQWCARVRLASKKTGTALAYARSTRPMNAVQTATKKLQALIEAANASL